AARPAREEWVLRVDRSNRPVAIAPAADGAADAIEIGIDGRTLLVRSDWRPGRTLLEGTVDGIPLTVQVERTPRGFALLHGGARLDVQVLTPRGAELAELMPVKAAPDMSKFLLSPMPGLLVSVAVTVGQMVRAGQELVVVE